MSSYRLATGPRGGLCLLSRIHPVAEYVDRLGQITSGLGNICFQLLRIGHDGCLPSRLQHHDGLSASTPGGEPAWPVTPLACRHGQSACGEEQNDTHYDGREPWRDDNGQSKNCGCHEGCDTEPGHRSGSAEEAQTDAAAPALLYHFDLGQSHLVANQGGRLLGRATDQLTDRRLTRR